MSNRIPNRPLNLAELETEPFRRVLESLDRLVRRHPGYYLHPSKRWEYPWALEQANLGEGNIVLDAGCGRSVFPLYLAGRGHTVYACDLEPPPPSIRPDRNNLHYAAADLAGLPWPDAMFDTVFLISVLEHLPLEQMPRALDEVRRVLRPGGRLLFTTDYYRDAAARLRYEGPDLDFEVDWNFFDRRRLDEIVLSHPGFRLHGDLDLSVDWSVTEPRMRAFHGYRYTSVGLTLVRE